MASYEPFGFLTAEDLLEKAEDLGIDLPFQESIDVLFEEIRVGSRTAPNRFAVQPMEGFDAEFNGTPGELALRRYARYARGGNGLIWFEATSVIEEGRSNPRQMKLDANTLDGFKRLVEKTRNAAHQEFGSKQDIVCILQLTHSGRYSRPEGRLSPQAACINPILDRYPGNIHVFSDDELNFLQEVFLDAARMAYEAGFDGVDIKACHGYLLHDLLSAHTREGSRYGGSFENRIRFLTELCEKIREEIPDLVCALRLNAYDGLAFPYGFGVPEDGSKEIDLSEPKELIRQMISLGCGLFNITVGIPQYNPHFSRPFDRPLKGDSNPPEHPLEGVGRLINITGEIQAEFSETPIVGTGYSWLRQYFPHVGAAVISRGKAGLIGLGRSSIAYPDAPKDLMDSGSLDQDKVCITCSRCTDLMRAGSVSGCSVRDREIYSRAYKLAFPKKGKPLVI